MDRTVKLWDPETGECLATLAGHREAITAIEWEPAHVDPNCRRLISTSKDGTARVWDTSMKQCLYTLSGHTGSITCVRWGGEGLIYTGSQDRTIKVWNANEGKLVRTLTGHGHWINTMALNTDYALRTGAFDHTGTVIEDPEEMKKKALERYVAVKGAGCEKLATGSDDFTIFLWEASTGKKPLERLTGHGKLINVVSFSPDGRLLATASFDKSAPRSISVSFLSQF
jgi:ribosome assembly protein 4